MFTHPPATSSYVLFRSSPRVRRPRAPKASQQRLLEHPDVSRGTSLHRHDLKACWEHGVRSRVSGSMQGHAQVDFAGGGGHSLAEEGPEEEAQ